MENIFTELLGDSDARVLLVREKVIVPFLCTWTESHQSKLSPVLTSLEILISSLAKVVLSVMSHHLLWETVCLLLRWNFSGCALKKVLSLYGGMTCVYYKNFSLHRSINIALNPFQEFRSSYHCFYASFSPKIFKLGNNTIFTKLSPFLIFFN